MKPSPHQSGLQSLRCIYLIMQGYSVQYSPRSTASSEGAAPGTKPNKFRLEGCRGWFDRAKSDLQLLQAKHFADRWAWLSQSDHQDSRRPGTCGKSRASSSLEVQKTKKRTLSRFTGSRDVQSCAGREVNTSISRRKSLIKHLPSRELPCFAQAEPTVRITLPPLALT